MNDFQMSHLAADRARSLHDEARRERLARTSRFSRPTPSARQDGRWVRFSLDALLGRGSA